MPAIVGKDNKDGTNMGGSGANMSGKKGRKTKKPHKEKAKDILK